MVDVPAFNNTPKVCIIKTKREASNAGCQISIDAYNNQIKQYLSDLTAFAEKRHDSTVINLNYALCYKGACHMMIDGKIAYDDSNHLNVHGAQHLGIALQKNYPVLFH